MTLTSRLLERLVGAIETATVLDRVADAGQKLTGALPAGPVKDLLSGTPIGHPLHPVLVTVPIGAFTASTYLDVVGESAASRRLIGLGLVSALPAAASGSSDWGDTLGAERRVGVVHALANTVGLGLLATSWVQRGAGRSGVASSLAGISVIGFSGWLGGHLSYAQGVGMDTTSFQSQPSEWTDACAEDDLGEEEPVSVTVADAPVLLLRRNGRVLAIGDRCTHRGGPLHEGPLVGDCVECPWHGSRFRLDGGEVERGPATRPQPTYDVRVDAGRVQLRRREERTLRTNPTS